jgi:hypothetical protein
MTTTRRAFLLATIAAIFIACASVTVLADGRVPQPTATKQFRCYCQCEANDGMAMCPKKMCDLPKYENRWWATSCHKRTETPAVSSSPAPQPSGSKTRRMLNARVRGKASTPQIHN